MSRQRRRLWVHGRGCRNLLWRLGGAGEGAEVVPLSISHITRTSSYSHVLTSCRSLHSPATNQPYVPELVNASSPCR